MVDINEVKEQVVDEKSGQFIIIMGSVGCGKSTMSSTFPKSLSLDLEGTASNIRGLKRISIKRGSKAEKNLETGKSEDTRDKPFLEMLDYAKQFLKGDKYDTLILDGGYEFVQYSQDFTVKRLGREEFSAQHAKFGDLWTKSRETMLGIIKLLIGNGKNVVLITHMDEVIDVNPLTDEEFTVNRPMIPDKQMVYKIPALANVVGRVNVDKEGKRSFDCVQTSTNVLKNQFDIDKPIEPTYEALFKEIKSFYKNKK